MKERKKQGILYNLHLLLVFFVCLVLVYSTVENATQFFKGNTFFLYKYVNIIKMGVVICCCHRAHALAGSQFLCKHTWEHVLLKQKKMMSVLNISSNGAL